MALAQQFLDLRLRRESRRRADCRDHRRLDVGDRKHLFLRGRVRNNHGVVLILSVLILSFHTQNTDHPEREIADSHRLADGIGTCKKIIGDCLSDHTDTCRGSHVALGEEIARSYRP